MVQGMKFQDKNMQMMRQCNAKKMIVGKRYCYKGKEALPRPDFSCMLKKERIAFSCCYFISYIQILQ